MEYSLTIYNIFKLHLPLCRQYIGTLEKKNDFLLLQEWVDSLHVAPHLYSTVQETFKLPIKKQKTGVATISRFPPVDEARFLSLSKELRYITPKSMVLTSYIVEGKKIYIINCHALNFVTSSKWKKTIDYWLLQIPESSPCIIAGDFNTWNTIRSSYLDLRLTTLGFLQASYTHPTSVCLDHIWYKDISMRSCEAHLKVHTSDHYPVTFTFTM